MADRVAVRCPACGRDHNWTCPSFPCACGAPLAVPVLAGGRPERIEHPSWEDSWLELRCPACGRRAHWPQPEFDCPCGALLRLPVGPGEPAGGEGQSAGGAAAGAGRIAAPGAADRRPPFRPLAIRTGKDALAAAAQYLRWLGFTDVRPAGDRTATGIDLRGDRLVAQVDPTTAPTGAGPVECLWLNCGHEDATGAFFSLAGYDHHALARADELGVPLFELDLTGTPQPVNRPATALLRDGPPDPGRPDAEPAP